MNTLLASTIGIWATLLAAPIGDEHPLDLRAYAEEAGRAAPHVDAGRTTAGLEEIPRGSESEGNAPFRLVVSISERKLYVRDGDETLGTYPIAVGKSDHPTPKGSFQIRRVIWNPRWVPPNEAWAKGKTAKGPGDPENPMGKVKMFFKEPDYYIHGTNDAGSLGRAASHGCLRMSNADVVAVAKLVMKNGGQPREQSWFRRVVNRVRSSEEVRLSRPVPVTIRA